MRSLPDEINTGVVSRAIQRQEANPPRSTSSSDGAELRAIEPVPLHVVFHEKNKLKDLGAKWDQASTRWLLPRDVPLSRFVPLFENGVFSLATSSEPETMTLEIIVGHDGTLLGRDSVKAHGAVYRRSTGEWIVPAGVDLVPFRRLSARGVVKFVTPLPSFFILLLLSSGLTLRHH